LGQTAAALDAYTHARSTFRQLAQQHGSPLAHRADAALCENNRGVLLVQLGRYAEAQQAYALALREQATLLAEQPDGQRLVSDMALTHLNLGRLQSQVGRFKEARASLTTAESLLARLALEAPGSRDIQLNRAAVLNALVALPTETPTSNRQHLQQAIDIYSQLLAAQPVDTELQHLLALAYNNLGTTLRQQWSVAAGVAALDAATAREVDVAYEHAVAIQSELVQQAPLVIPYHAELATTWNNLGQWRLDRGQASEAQEALIRAKGLLEPLCDEHPEQVVNRSSLGGVLNNLALVYERQGRLDEAAAALQAAIVHQQFAHEKAPRSERYQEFLRQHRENLSRVMCGRAQEDNTLAVPAVRDAQASG
jgi:tetratricopeptide (TPR) repeat protein